MCRLVWGMLWHFTYTDVISWCYGGLANTWGVVFAMDTMMCGWSPQRYSFVAKAPSYVMNWSNGPQVRHCDWRPLAQYFGSWVTQLTNMLPEIIELPLIPNSYDAQFRCEESQTWTLVVAVFKDPQKPRNCAHTRATREGRMRSQKMPSPLNANFSLPTELVSRMSIWVSWGQKDMCALRLHCQAAPVISTTNLSRLSQPVNSDSASLKVESFVPKCNYHIPLKLVQVPNTVVRLWSLGRAGGLIHVSTVPRRAKPLTLDFSHPCASREFATDVVHISNILLATLLHNWGFFIKNFIGHTAGNP